MSTPKYNSKIRGALKDSHLQADLEHETTSGASCGKQWASIQVLLCQYGLRMAFLWQEFQSCKQDSPKETGKMMHQKCPFSCLYRVLFWTSTIGRHVWRPTVSHMVHHMLFHVPNQPANVNLWVHLWFCNCIFMWSALWYIPQKMGKVWYNFFHTWEFPRRSPWHRLGRLLFFALCPGIAPRNRIWREELSRSGVVFPMSVPAYPHISLLPSQNCFAICLLLIVTGPCTYVLYGLLGQNCPLGKRAIIHSNLHALPLHARWWTLNEKLWARGKK